MSARFESSWRNQSEQLMVKILLGRGPGREFRVVWLYIFWGSPGLFLNYNLFSEHEFIISTMRVLSIRNKYSLVFANHLSIFKRWCWNYLSVCFRRCSSTRWRLNHRVCRVMFPLWVFFSTIYSIVCLSPASWFTIIILNHRCFPVKSYPRRSRHSHIILTFHPFP